MDKWWKNPVLQGEDNDYGQYDYLINPIISLIPSPRTDTNGLKGNAIVTHVANIVT